MVACFISTSAHKSNRWLTGLIKFSVLRTEQLTVVREKLLACCTQCRSIRNTNNPRVVVNNSWQGNTGVSLPTESLPHRATQKNKANHQK